tara:strand:+ start:121 stop:462 length:342 start_codon:yes stop_codon:yes gene_type:complete
MSTLINASIRVDKLPKEKFIKGKIQKVNGKEVQPVYYNLTISVSDETRYGNNVAITDSQTKEERDAKKEKNYLGNGKVVWTDGNVVLAEKENTDHIVAGTESAYIKEKSDLPF